MRVLIAYEFSGVVREAFRKRGHDAWSCDLLPSEKPGQHFQEDLGSVIVNQHDKTRHVGPKCGCWDMIIAFPPCTDLAVSGARWFKEKRADGRQMRAVGEVLFLWNLLVKRIAIENPIGVLSTLWRKPTQIIQPWQFGHPETKATCLWLKNLPKLVPTNIVSGRHARVHREPPGPDRWKNRSRTLQGIADAMADQWGSLKV